MLYTDCFLKVWLPTILANRAMCLRSAQKAIRHTRSTLTASSIRANTASTYNLQAVAHSLPVMLSKARRSGRLVCSCRSISKNCANAWRRMAL